MTSPEIRTISVYPFVLSNGVPNYLALHRRAGLDALGDTWQAVHGRIESGETAVQAALRELEEETGQKALRFWQVDYIETFYVQGEDSVQLVPCFAALIDQDIKLGPEHDAHAWLDIEEISDRFIWRNQRPQGNAMVG